MTEKGPKQKFVEIFPIPFHNNDPINDQLENIGKFLVALQPKYPLHSVVYTTSEANSWTPFNSGDGEWMLWMSGNGFMMQ